ncbi:hydroxylysine kinase [Pseudomyrmex gracilis]|uniref:hydroxylysine kinase n=1 Tax=Pseudomyrmex gracilis TaxID=219809 RepID=UPI000995952C|nr:hydroxylysine kinase [Pseudomyrmex gracilis]XP_020298167.1 hydroxylysine kinase [Pseudomyrmex gracilis]
MEYNDTLLIPGHRIRPPMTEETVVTLLERLYGMRATSVREINAYDDRNYHVFCEETHVNPHVINPEKTGYVFKVINSLDSRKTGVIEAQNEMMIFLNQRDICCPLPVKNMNGAYFSLENLKSENTMEKYAVKLLIYRPGELLHSMKITANLLRKVGTYTARIDKILMGFDHPAYDDHKTLWMLTSAPRIQQFTYALKSSLDKQLVHDVLVSFERDVLPITDQLEQGIIHGDLNEHNIIVNPGGEDIVAVIDFGDTHRTCLIFELAIVLCYMILQAADVAMGRHVVEGYEEIRKLSATERKILKISVCARMCQSLVMGAYSHLHDPENNYLLSTQKTGWMLLKRLWPMSQDEVMKAWGLN